MAMRLLALRARIPQQQAEQMLKTQPDTAESILREYGNMYWSFEPSPTLRDLDEEVSAFETIWGRSPTLIVVDNLMDIAIDGHEEFAGMRQVMKELKDVAKDPKGMMNLYDYEVSLRQNPKWRFTKKVHQVKP